MQYTDLFTHKASVELVSKVLMIRKKKTFIEVRNEDSRENRL